MNTTDDSGANKRAGAAKGAPSPDDPRVIEAVEEYLLALEAGEPHPREEFLQRHADIASALAECLEGLEFVRAATPHLQEPGEQEAIDLAHPSLLAAAVPLGDYRIVGEIGRGGMGIVYEAEQLSLHRRVALKVLPFAAMMDRGRIQRFKNEALAAAQLDHPNIVDVYGVGCERSVHFYAMRYIEGCSLADPLKEPHPQLRASWEKRVEDTPLLAGLSTKGSNKGSNKSSAFFRSVAEIGAQVAGALDYAHEHGVVHRDIKPSNLLLDMEGKAWVTDFGLAHVESGGSLTLTGDLLGTLRYMSPEQALAKRVVIDHRTDIYSLGATLYEVLAARPAFVGDDRQELLRQIAFDEPPLLRRINPAVPPELETIVLKTLEKNPADRYATAEELSDDLNRFLEDMPIRAKRPTLIQRLAKWARRHSSVVWTSVALLAVAAAASFAAALKFRDLAAHNAQLAKEKEVEKEKVEKALQREKKLRTEAVELRGRAQMLASESRRHLARLTISNGLRLMEEGDLAGSLPWFAEALTLSEGDRLSEQTLRIRFAAVLGQCPLPIQVWFHPGGIYHATFSPDGRLAATAGQDGAARVWDVRSGRAVTGPLAHAGAVHFVSFSPRGRFVVTAGMDKTARIWEASTGRPVTPPLKHDYVLNHVTFSPDGAYVATSSGDDPSGKGAARVWDARTGQPVTPPLQHARSVNRATFSPDGRLLATASNDHAATLWRIKTDQRVARLEHKHFVTRALFSPDGRLVLTASYDSTARLWDASSGELVRTLKHNGLLHDASFNPDGSRVVTASRDKTAQVWEVSTGRQLFEARHAHPVVRASFSPRGAGLATADRGGTVRIWNHQTGDELTALLFHCGGVMSALWSNDSSHVLTASMDGAARLWDIATTERSLRRCLEHSATVVHASFSPDGGRVVTAGADGAARVWDATTLQPITGLLQHESRVPWAVFGADGDRVVTASFDGAARVWDAHTGQLQATCQHLSAPLGRRPPRITNQFRHAAFSPDGDRVLTSGYDARACLWDAVTGELARVFEHADFVAQAWFSPDGRRIVTAGYDSTAVVWDAQTGGRHCVVRHGGGVVHVSFSRDGGRIVTTSQDNRARVWKADTGQAVTPWLRHNRVVFWASFSPDGRRVATAGGDQIARIWDAQTGEPTATPLAHDGMVRWVAFSRDGQMVVTGSDDKTARVWEAASGQPLTPPLRHPYWVQYAEFSPDGRRLLVPGVAPDVHLWDLSPVDNSPADLMLLGEVLAGRRIDSSRTLSHLAGADFRRRWEAATVKYADTFGQWAKEALARDFEGAENALRKGEWLAAVAKLHRLIVAQPDHWPHYVKRAWAHAGLQEWENAAADYHEAVRRGAGRTTVAAKLNELAWDLAWKLMGIGKEE